MHRRRHPRLEPLEPRELLSISAFPDTSTGIHLLSDQLAGGNSDALVRFIASHYDGTQKMLPGENARYRAANPNWVLLHYRLATASGPASYITGGQWGSDWASVTAHEDWFMHDPSGQRLHSSTWNWDLHDITNPAWRQYWLSSVIADMRTEGAQGVFADSFDAGIGDGWFDQTDPRFTGTNAANPAAWPGGVTWLNQLDDLINYVEAGFAATPEQFVYVPNLDALVTGWNTLDYSHLDGGFLEGFGDWGPAYLHGSSSDWTLSMNRALAMSGAGKILIMQPSLLDTPDSATGLLQRGFDLGTYLLLKGSHTYLNLLASGSSSGAYYYPEDALDLGPAVTPLAGDVSQYLWNNVYRRDFQNGIVLVNPTDNSYTVPLGQTYRQVQFSGGGPLDDASLDASGNYIGGSLSTTPVGTVTLAPGSAVILLKGTTGVATRLGVSAPAGVTAGTPFAVTVTARDAVGNVATGYTGTVHFTSTDPRASLPANYTFTAADAGTHTFTVTLATAGSRSVTATDAGNAALTGAGATVVGAAAASRLVLTAPAVVTSGTPFGVTVTALDPYGNTATGYAGTVSFTSSDGNPLVVLPAAYTFAAADHGVHALPVILQRAGGRTLTVTDPGAGFTAAANLAVSAAAPPARLAVVARDLTHSDESYSDFITAAYQRYLGRAPDAPGLAGWVAAMRNGLTDEQLEAGFLASPEYIAAHGGSGAGWVKGMYQDLLGRTPSQGEVDAWANALAGGAVTPYQVAYGFAASDERETQRVGGDYTKYLGRPGTPAEVAGWVNAFHNHLATNEDVIAGFVGSAEDYLGHLGNNYDWLVGAYRDVLGHDPDPASRDAWLRFLAG